MTLPTAIPKVETWDRVWERYETLTEPTTPRLVDTLASLDPKGKLICEVGCGTGKDSVKLASMGAKVVSVDFSQSALALVRRKIEPLEGPVPQLLGGDTLNLPFRDNTFDIMFHQGLLEHFHDPGAVLREQGRVIKSGGYLLVDVPQRFNWYAVTKRRQMARGEWFAGWETDFTLGGLRSVMRRAGFEPVASYAYGFNPPALWVLRHLHEVGEGRFGRPLMPRVLGRMYDAAWRWWEGTDLAGHALVCIGVLGRKLG